MKNGRNIRASLGKHNAPKRELTNDEPNENPTACAGSLKWTETNRTEPQRNNEQPQSWPKRQAQWGEAAEQATKQKGVHKRPGELWLGKFILLKSEF